MIPRRQFLRAGLTGGLGLVVSSWLERTLLAAPPEGRPAGKAKHVILLWMNGGPSHIDTWDPKQGKVAGPHKAIATSVNGVTISEHLPRMARLANKIAIVRGM